MKFGRTEPWGDASARHLPRASDGGKMLRDCLLPYRQPPGVDRIGIYLWHPPASARGRPGGNINKAPPQGGRARFVRQDTYREKLCGLIKSEASLHDRASRPRSRAFRPAAGAQSSNRALRLFRRRPMRAFCRAIRAFCSATCRMHICNSVSPALMASFCDDLPRR